MNKKGLRWIPRFCPQLQGSHIPVPQGLEKQIPGLPALYTVCGRDPAFMLPNAGARTGHFQSQPQPQPGEGPEGPEVLSERQCGRM